jgi:peptidoglycan hydrolase-like protein with peptidoglycan-binding domain
VPGIEVFTISGASSGYDQTTGMPLEPKLVPVTSSPPAAQLQNALKALGTTNGDPALASLTVDGIIGAKTVAAVNHALATYIGGSATFPAANLDVVRVRQYAGALAALVADRVKKSGGTVPPVSIQHPVRRVTAALPSLPSTMPTTTAMTASVFDGQKWIWWVVGGVGLLAVLTAATSAVKSRKAPANG